eukprot:SAG22_NODE_11509_length_481_cov_0.945026_1_plen_159_part_11
MEGEEAEEAEQGEEEAEEGSDEAAAATNPVGPPHDDQLDEEAEEAGTKAAEGSAAGMSSTFSRLASAISLSVRGAVSTAAPIVIQGRLLRPNWVATLQLLRGGGGGGGGGGAIAGGQPQTRSDVVFLVYVGCMCTYLAYFLLGWTGRTVCFLQQLAHNA